MNPHIEDEDYVLPGYNSVNGASEKILWEGHEVSRQYVDILTKIKLEHPETFDGVKFSIKSVDSFVYDFFGEVLTYLSEARVKDVTVDDITYYKNALADLEKMSFKIDWVREHIEKIEKTKFVKKAEETKIEGEKTEVESERTDVGSEFELEYLDVYKFKPCSISDLLH